MSDLFYPDSFTRDSDGDLSWYAWPGGYPLVYLDQFNDVYCPHCAAGIIDTPEGEYREIRCGFVYYEGPDMYCTECNEVIESAYGDPTVDNT